MDIIGICIFYCILDNVLLEQESQANILRQKSDRSSTMSDNDLLQLRTNIKVNCILRRRICMVLLQI